MLATALRGIVIIDDALLSLAGCPAAWLCSVATRERLTDESVAMLSHCHCRPAQQPQQQ